MPPKPCILLVDDEEIMRDVISRLLQEAGYRVITSSSGEDGLERIQQEPVGLVLLDLMLPGLDGLGTLEGMLDLDPDLVVVMITAYASIENAVKATRLGAFDFVTKPFRNEALLLVIKNGLDKRNLEIENRQLRTTFRGRSTFQNLIGKSEPMQQIYNLISQVGPGRSTVLIGGESGTGKELVAKAIHNLSPRVDEPFVTVNSGTIPSELLESELFGHVKGAFTGASSAKKGLFEIADTGTIFLDEIATVPLQIQSKLLRVIQEREFRRVGGLDNIKVDVRIVAASNVDLKQAVGAGEFREDLYYRLNVIRINLSPLRDRKDDIPLLVDHFVTAFCEENQRSPLSWDPDTLKALVDYDWPGNVRELENAIEHAVVLCPEEGPITWSLLPREILDSTAVNLGRISLSESNVSLKELVTEFERNLITVALKKTDWNQKKAASLLRINPTTLNEKLKRLEIKRS